MTRNRVLNSMSSAKSFLLTGGAAIAFSVALGVSGAASAQDEEESDEIVVQGFRSSLESSAAVKKNNTSIVEAVTAEDIGKLPDVSIAESLGRLPGLATQRLDGRSQVLTIRGLGPDFSTALLNGREQVSTSDNRGVEFDQYPSELLESAVVYKTPYAGLIGQGLAGTVDLRTIRPLSKGERIISGQARYEFNEDGSLNPDSPGSGWRGSAVIVDQFDNDRWGVALGVAYQSTPTQSERFNAWGYPTTGAGERIIGGAKPFVQSNDLDRFGVVGIIEFEPSANFSSAIDVYYSDFSEDQRLRGIEFPLFWSAAALQPGYTVTDGFVTDGSFANVKGVMRNDINQRDASVFAAGWNGKFDNGTWGLEMDVSYSKVDRHDDLIESYSGTSYGGGNGPFDTLGFSQTADGFFVFSPTLDYSGATTPFFLTDPQGWGAGNSVVQAGFINSPETEDDLWHLRTSVSRYLDGFFSKFEAGVDYSLREKTRNIDQRFLVLPGGAQTAPIPTEALLDEPTGLYFLGLGDQVTYDPLYLLENGFYESVFVSLSSFSVAQDWTATEDIWVGYGRFDIDGELGSLPVSGNVGVQAVYTDQTSSGFRIPTSGVISGTIGGAAQSVVDGDKYWKFLPSLNLIFHASEETKIRLSAARTLVRARMDQLNASLSLGTNITRLTSTDPNLSFFSASGGNPKLRPYIANGADISVEHYFGGAGYFAIGAFYKDLQDYVNANDSFIADFSQFIPFELTPAEAAMLGTPLGLVTGPTNNGKGHIKGIEATLSVPFGDTGFGVIASGSFNDSKVLLGGSTVPITVPGLSKWIANTSVYFERGGFEARVSHRYRSDFLAEVSGISATRILRTAKSESIIDAQVGYRFGSGALEGLNVYVQGNNLTDEPFVTFDNGDARQVIDYQSYGRTYLVGLNYKF
ncbi:MAG: TonB-dependent receptor [Pseudomonadota bacterium]